MEVLILNDGTTVEGHILDGGDERTIFIYLDNKTVVEGVTLMADPDKTRFIRALNHGEERTYEGYTQIYSASHEFGNCNLVMRRESNA